MKLKSILLKSSILALSLVAGTQAITEITSVDQFNREVLNSKETVVVDFHATWCGPCKTLGPILERASKQVPSIKVFKLDTDQKHLASIVQRYNIKGVPYVVALKNGQKVDSFSGAPAENIVVQFLSKYATQPMSQTPKP